ncbi:MAG: cytochrome c [Candidatus Contendobacter sp.]|nr:cytochrome c [Candidatus Contendobacter sp.]
MRKIILVVAVPVAVIGGAVASVMAQQPQNPAPPPWSQCCGMSPWPMGQGMMGQGMMGQGMMGSMPRHHFAMMSGIPASYRSLTNPLPRTRETVERGATVYEKNCASCHGATGAGDGAAGQNLSPRPGNLAWLAQMPMVQWDSFMYWTVTEGGTQFKTAMPAFKDTLPKDDIWAVIAYIQAQLPQTAKPAN